MAVFQSEINEQTIPATCWGKLVTFYHKAHSQMHRGMFGDWYDIYAEAVADALYLDKNDLMEYIKSQIEDEKRY